MLHFISNYSQEVEIPQPTAPRGRDREAPVYLLSHTTKIVVHKAYKDSCAEMTPPARVVKYSTSNNIWRACVPPRKDVCATCERIRKAVSDVFEENETLASAEALRQHIITARKERDAAMPTASA